MTGNGDLVSLKQGVCLIIMSTAEIDTDCSGNVHK